MSLFPELDQAFLDSVDPFTAGDPDEEAVLWTNLSRPQIAQELRQRGFRVSVTVVGQLLQRHRLGHRKALKTLSLGQHACRDRQFQIIQAYRQEFAAAGNPIVSMDTKHKEFLGLLFREGRIYTQQAVAVNSVPAGAALDGAGHCSPQSLGTCPKSRKIGNMGAAGAPAIS